MQVGRILTILVVILGIAFVGSLIYLNYEAANEYSSIKYNISRLSPGYDYSCEEPVYGLYVVISNNGTKTVSDFSVSISNPLCKGAIPPLPAVLPPSQETKFYVYSSAENGTLTITGNNTLLEIRF